MKNKNQTQPAQTIQISEGNTGFLTVKILSEILSELRKLNNKG